MSLMTSKSSGFMRRLIISLASSVSDWENREMWVNCKTNCRHVGSYIGCCRLLYSSAASQDPSHSRLWERSPCPTSYRHMQCFLVHVFAAPIPATWKNVFAVISWHSRHSRYLLFKVYERNGWLNREIDKVKPQMNIQIHTRTLENCKSARGREEVQKVLHIKFQNLALLLCRMLV